jgi:hypothetical protein
MSSGDASARWSMESKVRVRINAPGTAGMTSVRRCRNGVYFYVLSVEGDAARRQVRKLIVSGNPPARFRKFFNREIDMRTTGDCLRRGIRISHAIRFAATLAAWRPRSSSLPRWRV